MYRQRDPQSSLFEASNLIPRVKAERLEASWAETFRHRALPLIDEDLFAVMYCDDNGRPNRPVQTVFGVLVLKEMYALTDMEALEQLEFNLLWQHALALTPEEAHLCQKTLHNFRPGLMAHDLARLAFTETTDRILAVLGTKAIRQRLDSTHVISNIAVLTRLGLFCETMRVFLSQLRVAHPRLYGRVPESVRGRYVKDDGSASGYRDARSGEGRRRLPVCARDLYRLCDLFGGTAAEQLEGYALMQRLLAEQCDVAVAATPPCDDDDVGEGGVPVVLKAAKQVSSASLQSPHDADVTYSGHKGKGYEIQIAETCHEDNAVEVLTYVEVTDSCVSDAQATVPTLEALAARDLQPAELAADTTYGSGDNAVEAERMGTELISPVAGAAPAVAENAPGERVMSSVDFRVDARPEEPAICPAGHFSIAQAHDEAHPNRVEVTFDRTRCEGCDLFHRCPARLNQAEDGYLLRLDLMAANLARRRRTEASGEFEQRHDIRTGIEATNSETKRAHGLDDLRVRGRLRVELAANMKALACNFKRMVRALMPERGNAIAAMA
jgi:DDE family transposase/transposase-like protein DUF772